MSSTRNVSSHVVVVKAVQVVVNRPIGDATRHGNAAEGTFSLGRLGNCVAVCTR